MKPGRLEIRCQLSPLGQNYGDLRVNVAERPRESRWSSRASLPRSPKRAEGKSREAETGDRKADDAFLYEGRDTVLGAASPRGLVPAPPPPGPAVGPGASEGGKRPPNLRERRVGQRHRNKLNLSVRLSVCSYLFRNSFSRKTNAFSFSLKYSCSLQETQRTGQRIK